MISVIKTLAEKKHAGSSSGILKFPTSKNQARSIWTIILLGVHCYQSSIGKAEHDTTNSSMSLTGWSLHVRQSAYPAAAAARKNPAGQQLCKWPSKNWQARESPNPKQMPVTSNVTRSLEIHNSKQQITTLLGKLNSPQIFFMVQIPGWGSSYKTGKPQTWLKVGNHTYPGDKKNKKCCYPIGVWSNVCDPRQQQQMEISYHGP